MGPEDSMDLGIVAHNVFDLEGVIFSSNFDNGNLLRVERGNSTTSWDYKVWTAPDNYGTPHQSKHCAWFYFTVSGLPMGATLSLVRHKIHILDAFIMSD
jgi:hypothetical protein